MDYFQKVSSGVLKWLLLQIYGESMQKLLRHGLVALMFAWAMPALAEPAANCPPPPAQPTAELYRDAAKHAGNHGFMWRIAKDGRTSYLYGTLHLAKRDWTFPGPDVMQALNGADTVAVELDMADPALQERLVKSLRTMRGAELPEKVVNRLKQQARLLCVPYDTIASLVPEFQLTALGVEEGRWADLHGQYAPDLTLAVLARAARKGPVSLETPEFQLQALRMETPQQTAAYVDEGLKEMESGRSRTMLARIARAWADSDYAELENFEQWCGCLDSQIEREVMKRLLDDRNPGLAESIDALHNSGKQVFAAVGSLHMFGRLGLPALMAQRGYRVERIVLQPN